MARKLEEFDDKAYQLADAINGMKIWFHLIDLDYAKQAAADMHRKASFTDSAAVLNPLYNPLKPDIMRKQAKALNLLIQVIEELKEVDRMKAKLSEQEKNQQDIINIFK